MRKRVRFFLTATALIIVSNFCYAQPTISSFSPASGPVGTTVTISGTNFNSTPANNIVYFGVAKAVVNAATATALNVTVPYAATFQPISVTVNNLTAWSNFPFIITFNATSTDFTASTFASRFDLPIGGYQGCAIGDFDNDGKNDLTNLRRS